jgi:hypothetical protein
MYRRRGDWSKYAANDKTQCFGMTKTGGPADCAELLSCLEIMRDAREIQNADPLESDTAPRTRAHPRAAGTRKTCAGSSAPLRAMRPVM